MKIDFVPTESYDLTYILQETVTFAHILFVFSFIIACEIKKKNHFQPIAPIAV